MINKETSTKRKVRNDIILVGGLLIIAAIGIFYLFVLRKTGDSVNVTVDGNTYKTFSLSENVTEDIYTGESNEHLNRLIIKDGKAYMETATCPDGICVEHNPVYRDGESIVCLPNRVVVTVTTQNSNDPDIVI